MNQDKIKKLVAGYDKSKSMKDRQSLLKRLVENYGYDNVSLASGWSVATIIQYCKASNPVIGLERLSRAENVLKQL